ncbi:MAG: hypothetical protein B6A08_14215 [Sorangiineae bacterium NIC37A_2]|nr:MAG: hypothetical protein B6A08_14215 [Sorangiineae bacterium NIC37A_2]
MRPITKALRKKLVGLSVRVLRDSRTRRVARAVLPRAVLRMIRERRVGRGVIAAFDKDSAVGVAADALWRGFSERSLAALESAKTSPLSSQPTIAFAARELAIWYSSHGDFERALENLILLRYLETKSSCAVYEALLESECHMCLGAPERAKAVLEPLMRRLPNSVDLRLAYCNTLTSVSGEAQRDGERLEMINRIFEEQELAPLARWDATKPLLLDNLTTKAVPGSKVGGPKVTVIVPAFNAEKRLGKTLECLLQQTWAELEVIVVDDDSTDRTLEVAEEFARRDSRVSVLRQSPNSGTYCGRNLALTRATGEYVTVHDDDDWSHPERIALQAEHLRDNPAEPANITDWVRALNHLYFRPTARRGRKLVTQNYSSLMVRRDLLENIGGWDRVRVSADSELIARLEHYTGKQVVRLMKGVPLSFALDSGDSLTRQGLTHIFTIYYGVRRSYQDMAAFWRAQHERNAAVLRPGSDRAFPAPLAILPKRGAIHEVDVLIASNFAMIGGAFISTKNYVDAAVQSGLRTAVFHYPRYGARVAKPPHDSIRRMVHEGQVSFASPGEAVRARVALVGFPVVLSDFLDRAPAIECDKFGIITNQMSRRLYSGGDIQYDPTSVEENVARMFEVADPTWIPISDLVRGLMASDPRYRTVNPETWNPLIDSKTWCSSERPFRGRTRKVPVVGRHGRDHYTKWPTSKAALEAAYCVGKKCDVQFLGGVDRARDVVGKMPSNWTNFRFGSRDVWEFLSELDFFVHYPHEDYIEEFGRAVLEALAAGVPAILPPVFESTFGPAALYARPEEVWDVIESLWASEVKWLERVEIGRTFVREKCDWSLLPGRLERLNALARPETESGAPALLPLVVGGGSSAPGSLV